MFYKIKFLYHYFNLIEKSFLQEERGGNTLSAGARLKWEREREKKSVCAVHVCGVVRLWEREGESVWMCTYEREIELANDVLHMCKADVFKTFQHVVAWLEIFQFV